MILDCKREKKDGIALMKGDSILSTTSCIYQIKALHEKLKSMSILSGDKVLIYISNEFDLLPVILTLININVTCVPINPLEKKINPEVIARQCQAKFIITEKKYKDLIISFDCVIVDNDEVVSDGLNFIDKDFDATTILFLFFEEKDNRLLTKVVNHKTLINIFDDLDQLLSTSGNDVLMLSNCIPFSRLIMELIWAFSRGIKVILESLDSNFSHTLYQWPEGQLEMDFGLFYFGSGVENQHANKYKLLFDTVQFADKNGFTSIWTPERHFNEFGGLFPNPSVLSAALAVTTTTVQIRCGSIVAPLHHPVRIAEDWSLIDNLSNGRVGISFASGWQCDDFIFSPEKYPDRHEYMMNEIEIIKLLWEGGKTSFKNGYGKDIDVSIYPKPIQKQLPIWVTVSGKTETFVDAGKIGANILTHLLWQDTDELIKKISAYRQSLIDHGFDPYSKKVSVMVHTYIGEDDDRVKNTVKEPLKDYIRTSTQLINSMIKSNINSTVSKEVGGRYGEFSDGVSPDHMDELLEIAFNRFYDNAGLLGTIEKSNNMIKKLKKYGVDEVACLIDFGLSEEKIMEGLVELNKLRMLYDKKVIKDPVTITHCALQTLDKVNSDPNISNFLATQRVIIVEANDFKAIPPHLLHKVKIIQDTINEKDELTICLKDQDAIKTDLFFNSSISNDF